MYRESREKEKYPLSSASAVSQCQLCALLLPSPPPSLSLPFFLPCSVENLPTLFEVFIASVLDFLPPYFCYFSQKRIECITSSLLPVFSSFLLIVRVNI